jgi:cobalt-zinc-cadmium resistance protein CzcA
MMDFFERYYQHALDKILNFPKTVIIAAVSLFVISLWVLSNMGGEFIPALEEGDFAVETRVLTGSNLTTTINSTQKAAHILKTQFPEVEQVVTKIGSGEIPTDPMPMEAADMMVILKDKSEWTSAENFPDLAKKMSAAVAAVPGITTSFQFPVQMRFNELMTGAKQDVVCKIFGENMDTLAFYAEKLGKLSSDVEGTKNIYVEPVTGLPQIIIEYNRSAVSQYGLNISDINHIVNTGLAGQSAGFVYEGEKRFDLVLRINNEQKKDIEDIRNLLIPTQNGNQIPLYLLANVEMKDGPNQIQREDAKRRIIVGFNVGGRDVQTIVEELQKKVETQIKLPAGYYITYGGAFENLNAAKARLSIAVPVALLLIFILLYFSFNSVKQGLLIYSAIPLSATGGIFALALRNMPFSISAGVGFIALFGVAVLNGIVLIAEFNRLKAEGWNDSRKIVLMGTKIRLRPVLMTGFVASFGFLPMALSGGAGAEVQRPLATVVIGGLLIATFLTLFVLPVLYIIFEKGIKRKPKNTTPVVTATLMILMICFSQQSSAQTKISLSAALDTAVKNNLLIRSEKLNAEYLEKTKGIAWDIPKTDIAFEYGQLNSIYTDNRFSVSQSIKFPTVYSNQKSVLNQEWKSGLLNLKLKEKQLKTEVEKVFYELLYMQQKQKLLLHTDSIFSEFLKNATLRFTKGEANILEKTTAETQRGQINQQLLQLQQDYEVVKLKFRFLLNSVTDFIPGESELKINTPVIADTSVIENTYELQLLKQQEQTGLSKLRLEKSKLLPDIFASYNNGTIKGYGSDNVLYSLSDRFQSFQLGLSVPLFFSSQKASISSMKANLNLVHNNYSAGFETVLTDYKQTVIHYTKNLETIAYYETSANKNAETILTIADNQFKNGDINYLEWVLLTNNAITIQSEYIDALKKLNESIIKINSFNNN